MPESYVDGTGVVGVLTRNKRDAKRTIDRLSRYGPFPSARIARVV